MSVENILSNLVRIGVVSSVDPENRRARVIFKDKGFVSGWLYVLQHIAWMPAVNDAVVCLYIPVSNGDGFILGSSSALGKEGEVGPPGPQGDKGDKGEAATVTVGTVTTLDAGMPATVINSGTAEDATLDFGIPKGFDGEGSGDVLGPATNTNAYIPVWNGSNTKTLGPGIPQSTFLGKTEQAADSVKLGGVDQSRFLRGENSTGTNNASNFNIGLMSGFHNYNGATGSPSATWYHLINSRHTNEASVYQFQLACHFWSAAELYARIIENSNVGSWYRVHSDANIQIRTGQCTLNTSSEVWVAFSSAFPGTPGAVMLTPQTTTSGVIAGKVRSKANTGFNAIIGGSGFSNILFDYIAIYLA